jgi:hypothetical protein
MTALDRRLLRLHHSLPPPLAPPRTVDYTRLTPTQLERYQQLGEQVAAVGLRGLTDAELVEIADLVTLVERES